MQTKQCTQCSKTFRIEDQDLVFYDKVNVSIPTLCPNCREQRRLAWRNETQFYSRVCDLCKRSIISIYSNDKPFPVYCSQCYWSDQFDPSLYGQEYDVTESFFAQIKKLQDCVPRLAIINRNSENSEYTNICERNKNCYMIIESSNNENCLYSYWIQKSKDLVDCSFCSDSELCYDCDNCNFCYQVQYSRNCANCSDSAYLENCAGLTNCLGCVNLVNKQYYILNKQYSQDEYQKYVHNLDKQKFLKDFQELVVKQPKKYAEISKSEQCVGNYIMNSNHCETAFHAQDSDYCRYAYHVWRQAKDCMDVDTVGMQSELIYESINTAINSYNCQFCVRCWTVRDAQYCLDCDNSQNIFGCISLRSAKYCILNKQYSQTDYENLRAKIITSMKQTGEYGEFLPVIQSPYAYNETAAMLYYPLTESEVTTQGWQWREPDIKTKQIAAQSGQICESCYKPFKYIAQETKFYSDQAIVLPKTCFQCRLKQRLQQRNPNQLWQRQCMCTQVDHNHAGRCTIEFETTYSPDRKELIYCEQCYLSAVV